MEMIYDLMELLMNFRDSNFEYFIVLKVCWDFFLF
jgi:hypothetical protein